METEKLEVDKQRRHSSIGLLKPQDLCKFGSSIDVSLGASLGEISFKLADDATVSTVWPQILACTSAASFHFAGGAVLGFSAILIPQLEAADTEIVVDKIDISWIASLVALVVPIGALLTGYMVDRIGRLHTMRLGAVPFIAGWVCIALAQDLRMLLVGRFLTGIAMALGTNPGIVYITEIARADLRGALICMAPSLVSMGMVATYTMGAFLYWRTIAWITSASVVLPLVMMSIWSPESPVWLVSRGRNEDALKSLTYLSRREKNAGAAESALAALVAEHNIYKARGHDEGSAFKKLLWGLAQPNGYKPLLLLTVIFAFQQFSGIYITIFYAVSFFQDMGANVDPYVSSVGIGVVRLIIGVITAFLLKSFGRRPLFLISGIGMAVFMFISGYITKEVIAGNREPSIIPVVCILLYMSVGVIGLLSIPWTMTAELFALEIRGMAQGVIVSLANMLMFAAIKVYPFLTDWLGGVHAVQWLFAGVALVAVVFIFIFLPETHRKELSAIQQYFKHNTVYILKTKKRPTRKPEVVPNRNEVIKIVVEEYNDDDVDKNKEAD